LGNKEYLQKELDLLLEKLRFWRYVLFALVLSGFLGIILSIKRLTYLTQEYKQYLKELKDAE